MKKLILFVVCMYAGSSIAQSFNSVKEMQAHQLKEFTKSYGAKAAKRMMNNEVWIGMSDKMCLDEFTAPNRKKSTYTKSGKAEIWYYQGKAAGCIGDCPYLDYVITFENHLAVAITTSD